MRQKNNALALLRVARLVISHSLVRKVSVTGVFEIAPLVTVERMLPLQVTLLLKAGSIQFTLQVTFILKEGTI